MLAVEPIRLVTMLVGFGFVFLLGGFFLGTIWPFRREGGSMTDRLLNPLEVSRCIRLGMDAEEQITAICTAQRQATLKEVGKWIVSHPFNSPDARFFVEFVSGLLRGEMSAEEKA